MNINFFELFGSDLSGFCKSDRSDMRFQSIKRVPSLSTSVIMLLAATSCI